MYCQSCGARNSEDEEYCVRCHQKLLVVSGPLTVVEEEGLDEDEEESFSFDEHLLERISVLEEAVKRTAETLRQLLGAVRKQEQTILVNQTGLAALRELLEAREVLDGEEWDELWESKMDFQLLALEKRERFVAVRDRIASLYGGDAAARVPGPPRRGRERLHQLRGGARHGGARGSPPARPRQLRARLLPR